MLALVMVGIWGPGRERDVFSGLLAVQDANHEVYCHLALGHGHIRRRRRHLAFLDLLVEGRNNVGRNDLRACLPARFRERPHRRIGHDGAAYQIVDLGKCLKRVLDQFQLDVLAGVSPLDGQYVDFPGELLDRFLKAVDSVRRPSRPGRPRKEDDVDLCLAFGVLHEEFPA